MTSKDNNEEYAAISQRFHDRLDGLQQDCSPHNGRYLLVDESADDFETVPSLISRRMLYVQLAYILNRMLVIKPAANSPYGNCYLPHAACDWRDIEDVDMPVASFDVEQFERAVRFDFDGFWANERLRRYFFPWAPVDFTAYKCPRLLFDGETLKRLPLTEPFLAAVEEATAGVGFDEPTIGLHLGPGTEVSAEPDASTASLIASLRSIAQTANISRVLVTGDEKGDDVRALQECDVRTVNTPPCQDGPYRSLIEFELLSACEWVVGRVTADAPRLAAARIGLRTFRCDRHRLVTSQPQRRGLGRYFARA